MVSGVSVCPRVLNGVATTSAKAGEHISGTTVEVLSAGIRRCLGSEKDHSTPKINAVYSRQRTDFRP
jgi:hypothetical protein